MSATDLSRYDCRLHFKVLRIPIVVMDRLWLPPKDVKAYNSVDHYSRRPETYSTKPSTKTKSIPRIIV